MAILPAGKGRLTLGWSSTSSHIEVKSVSSTAPEAPPLRRTRIKITNTITWTKYWRNKTSSVVSRLHIPIKVTFSLVSIVYFTPTPTLGRETNKSLYKLLFRWRSNSPALRLRSVLNWCFFLSPAEKLVLRRTLPPDFVDWKKLKTKKEWLRLHTYWSFLLDYVTW